MNQDKQYPGIAQAIWILVLFYLLYFAVGIPIAIINIIFNVSFSKHPIAISTHEVVAIGLLLWWRLKKNKISFREIFPITPISIPFIVPLLLSVFGLSILISEIDNLFQIILTMPPEVSDILIKYATGQKSLFNVIFFTIIVVPIAEEILFRGFILRGFLSRYTGAKSIIVSAILFGIIHIIPWQIPGAIIWGFFFAWMFVRTRSLLPCIIGHTVANAMPMIWRVSNIKIPGFTEITKTKFQPFWLDLIGILLTGLGLWLLTCQFRNKKN